MTACADKSSAQLSGQIALDGDHPIGGSVEHVRFDLPPLSNTVNNNPDAVREMAMSPTGMNSRHAQRSACRSPSSCAPHPSTRTTPEYGCWNRPAIHPTIAMTWVDQGFKNRFVEHAATLGFNAEVVTRNPEARGFHVRKRRWVAERTIG